MFFEMNEWYSILDTPGFLESSSFPPGFLGYIISLSFYRLSRFLLMQVF